MNQTHSVPEIYNPDVPYPVKCEIVTQLCRALAAHKNMAPGDLRKYLLDKLHVDFENLDDNPVGMLLLYKYLYSQRPPACAEVKKNFIKNNLWRGIYLPHHPACERPCQQ